jgi:hypothetical protein
MILKNYLLAFLLIFSTASFAQKPYQIILKNEPIKISNVNFSVDSIIDNRHYRKYIGMVKKRRREPNNPAFFEEKFVSLKKYLQKNAVVNQPNPTSIYIIVNHFWIWQDMTDMNNYGHCDMDLEFCRKDPSGKLISCYRFIKNIEEIDDEMPVSHERRIRKSLSEALIEFGKVDFNNVRGEAKILTNKNSQNSITNTQPLKKGIFKSLEDFYNNSPSDTSEVMSIIKVNDERSFLTSKGSNEKKTYFAYCDGKDTYLNTFGYAQPFNNQYAKILDKGRFILVDDIVPQEFAPSPEMYALGLAGVLAAYAIGSGEKRGYVIDTKKGLLFAFNYDNLNYVVSEFPEIQKKWNDSASYNFKTKRKFIGLMNAEK